MTVRQPRTIEVTLDVIECEACGRSLLRGEHPKVFVDTDMMRRMVCDLCRERAGRAGWLPEAAQRFAPAGREEVRSRRLLSRLIGRGAEPEPEPIRATRVRARHAPPWSPAQVPVVAQALEAFNASHYPRMVAGVARSLGAPFVSVLPCPKRGGIVSIVVGWRLAWFRYEVDPAGGAAGVRVVGQGEQLSELAPHERLSNAAADEDGCLRGEPLAA